MQRDCRARCRVEVEFLRGHGAGGAVRIMVGRSEAEDSTRGVSIRHLLLKGARDFLKDQNTYLEGEVERRMRARQG